MRDIINKIKALSDASRLRVLMALLNYGELCACQITELLNLSPATVSNHMSVLQQGALVENRKKGKWVYYRISHETPKELINWLKESLKGSHELAADESRLKHILAIGVEELCKLRKKKKIKAISIATFPLRLG